MIGKTSSLRTLRRITAALLMSLAAICVYSQDTEFGVLLESGIALPLGADREIYDLGGAFGIVGSYSPGGAPWLAVSAGGGYTYTALPIDTGLSLLTAGGSAGLRVPLGEGARVQLAADGGYYYGFLNDGRLPRVGGAYVGGSVGFGFGVSPAFSLGLSAGYRMYLGLGRFIRVQFLTTLHSRRSTQPIIMEPTIIGPRPLEEAADDEYLQISRPDIGEIFPVFFKYYDAHPIGSARITNVAEGPITEIAMSLYVAQYMDNPTACDVSRSLQPGQSARVDLNGFFNDTVLRLEQPTLVSAELSVTFEVDGQEHRHIYTETIRLHDRNSMVWDDLRKPAAYVTPQDGTVLAFSRYVSGIVRESEVTEISHSFQVAMATHAALNLLGMAYTPDPSSPYRHRETELAIDYLQHPRQTIAYRGGDCDDLAILYCALLESLGIPTAMILVPGHIYMAANLRMTEAEAMRQFHGTEDLIIRNDEAWLPIEVTSISDGFVAAWRAGARRWREAVSAGDVDFVVTSEAWEAYEPVGLPASEQQITLPPTDGVRQSFQDQLDRYIDQTLYPMVERIEERMVERGRQPSLVNSLAVLYARYGRLTEARSELENLLDEHPGYAPAIANLGNICFLEGETEEAVNYFERALALEPDNASILVALARASHQLENYGTAQRAYDRVKELEPALAAEYSYLELRDGGGARAAEAGAEAATPWVEETE
jgi:hypothetical protein